MKTIEQRLIEWFVSGDTGLSSEAIAAHMSGAENRKRMDYPSDPSDLGRCLRLLDKIPEWKDRIGEMSQYSPGWAGLVKNWNEISKSMEDEVGINWQKAKSAPITYDMMKLAQAGGFLADDRFECEVSKLGYLSSWRKKYEPTIPTKPTSPARTKLPIRSRIKSVRYVYVENVGGVGG